ncbi:hypothetical protein [Burkholderia diffusa]|uniref:hypothetical protein n=1 Tax=Burkholderia diffusa TaxID=488732 RepID=UPI002AAF212D|nr:hypothetical protein [Burkholderia diffusa]
MLKGITNPISASGNGFTYEHRVAAVYASALLCEQSAQALEGRIVKRVALQRKVTGTPGSSRFSAFRSKAQAYVSCGVR